MQVTREFSEPEFKPFKIIIAIETEEEARTLREWSNDRAEWLAGRARSGRHAVNTPATPLLNAITAVLR